MKARRSDQTFDGFSSSFSYFSCSFQLAFVTERPRLGILPARDEKEGWQPPRRFAGLRNYRARRPLSTGKKGGRVEENTPH